MPNISNHNSPRSAHQEFRINAVKRVLAGETPRSVMEGSGLHPSNIYGWLKKYRAHGPAALQTHKRAGRPQSLNQTHEQIIVDHVVTLQNAKPILWTRHSIAQLIQKHSTSRPSTTAVTHFLNRFGVHFKRPLSYIEKNYPNTAHANQQTFLQCKKKALSQKAILYFCTYSISKTVNNTIHCLAVTTAKGERKFSLFNRKISQKQFIAWLTEVANNETNNIILLTDNASQSALFTTNTLKRTLQALPKFISVTALQLEKNTETKQPKKVTAQHQQSSTLTQELTALIYKSVLEPLPWYSFLRRVNSVFNCKASISVNMDMWNGVVRPDINVSEFTELCKIAERVWRHHPLKTHLNKPGDVRVLSELYSQKQLRGNPYVEEYLHDFDNSCYEIILYVSGPQAAPRILSLTRSENHGEFDNYERKILTELLPHLQVGMETYIRLRQSELSLKALHDAASHLEVATIVLDGAGFVLNGNTQAFDLVEKRKGLWLTKNKITFSNSHDTRLFAKYIKRAISWRLSPNSHKPVQALRTEYEPNRFLGVLVQPIETKSLGEPAYITPINPHIIVHINDPANSQPDLDQQRVAHLFGLSAQEAHLATLLANGHSIDNAAAMMDVTPTTARTYLQRIYSKLNINRQIDLIQLVSKSVALL